MIGSEPRSVLVVLPTWVGDFVMSTPTLRAIRRRFAGAHILFLMESNLRDLARGGDWMDECIEWPARNRRMPWHREYRALVRDLRRRQLDLAVVLPNSARSAIIPFLAKARRRIGYNREGRGFLLTDRVTVKNRRARRTVGGAPRNSYGKPGKSSDDAPGGEGETGSGPQPHQPARLPAAHASASVPAPPGRFTPLPLVEYYADLAEAVGCERPGDKLELFTTSDCEQSLEERFESWDSRGGDPLVVISPGAKYGAAKCWPPERFAAVADMLVEQRDAAVVVTCGPGEEPIARAIGAAMRRNGLVLTDPALTLGELKSLIKRCDLLICNDAGPRHFAKAFGVPVVTVFGPTHPRWTATDYPAERIVRVDVECGPCQKRVCPLGHLKCMTLVSAEMVFEAADELL